MAFVSMHIEIAAYIFSNKFLGHFFMWLFSYNGVSLWSICMLTDLKTLFIKIIMPYNCASITRGYELNPCFLIQETTSRWIAWYMEMCVIFDILITKLSVFVYVFAMGPVCENVRHSYTESFCDMIFGSCSHTTVSELALWITVGV